MGLEAHGSLQISAVEEAPAFFMSTMVKISTLALLAVLPILGDIAALLSFILSSLPKVLKIVRNGNVNGVVSGLQPVLEMFSYMMWELLYGIQTIQTNGFYFMNGVELCLSLLFLTIYLCFASRNQKRNMIRDVCVALALVVVVWCFVLYISKPSTQHDNYQRRQQLIAMVLQRICVVTSSLMQIAALYRSLRDIVETGEVGGCMLDVCSMAAAFAGGALGTIHGFLTAGDFYMMAPNALAAGGGAAQFVVWGIIAMCNRCQLPRQYRVNNSSSGE